MQKLQAFQTIAALFCLAYIASVAADANETHIPEKANRRLEEFVDRAGILVVASQNLALLERVCATGVLLKAGKIKARGPIKEVLCKYRQAA